MNKVKFNGREYRVDYAMDGRTHIASIAELNLRAFSACCQAKAHEKLVKKLERYKDNPKELENQFWNN